MVVVTDNNTYRRYKVVFPVENAPTELLKDSAVNANATFLQLQTLWPE